MRGLLGFLVFAAVFIAVLVFAVVPLAAGPIIASALQNSGALQGGALNVDAEGSGPGFVTGRADALRLRGTDVDVQGLVVGEADVTLRGVSIAARTFDTVEGALRDVRLRIPDGPSVTIATVDLDGPAAAVRARGVLDEAQAAVVVREAARRAGVRIDSVALRDGALTIGRGAVTVGASLTVRDGALVLVPGSALPIVVLVRPSAGDPWSLSDVTLSASQVQLVGTLDARELLASGGLLEP